MSETVQCHVLATNLYNNIIYIYIFYILLITHILYATIFATSISTHFRIPTMASMIYIKLGNPLQASIMSSSKLPKRQESMDWSNRGTSKMMAPTGFSSKPPWAQSFDLLAFLRPDISSLMVWTAWALPKQKMAIATTISSDDTLDFSSHHPSNVKGKIGQGFYAWTWFKRSATKCATQGLKCCHQKTIHLDALSKRWAKGIPHTATHQWWPEMFELWQPMLQRWDRWNQPVQLWYELDYLSPRFHYIFRVQLQYAKYVGCVSQYTCSQTIIIHHTLYCIWQFIRT